MMSSTINRRGAHAGRPSGSKVASATCTTRRRRNSAMNRRTLADTSPIASEAPACLQRRHQFLEARQVLHVAEVRIVLDPFQEALAALHGALQQVEAAICVVAEREIAGRVVQHVEIVE